MDITKTTEPRSDQLNFDDTPGAEITITIVEVKAGPPDQPVHLLNEEYPGRPYKPGKSMRRVLIAAWGPEASTYIGRQIRLYGDPTVRFGSDAVGGLRIRALSHIAEPLTIALTVTRGKRTPYTVEPLERSVGLVSAAIADLTAAGSEPALRAAWDLAGKRGVARHPDVIAAKERRKAELTKEKQ